MKDFSIMNQICKKQQTVFFGSTNLSMMDLSEMLRESTSSHIYNRSIEGLKLKDVDEVIATCAVELQPSKLFINLGEEDIKNPNFDRKSFIFKYEWLLYQLHTRCKNCTLYITSVMSDSHEAALVNKDLEALASDTGCTYVRIARNSPWDFINCVKHFVRNSPITFGEAMQYAG